MREEQVCAAEALRPVQGGGAPAVAFFDIDGTLIYHDPERLRQERESRAAGKQVEWSEEPVRPAVARAIDRMRANGHYAFVCTGRPVSILPAPIRQITFDGVIAEAGAYIELGDAVIREAHIPFDLLVETARRFVGAGIDVDMESNVHNIELYPSGAPRMFPGAEVVRTIDEFCARANGLGIAKFCTHGATHEQLAPIMPFISKHYTACDLQHGTTEFSMIGFDKGAGIAAVLERLGHGRERTFAFGDSENDLSMAPAVETFVAMGNALPGVKARADYVTDDAAHDGVATGLAHFGLIWQQRCVGNPGRAEGKSPLEKHR